MGTAEFKADYEEAEESKQLNLSHRELPHLPLGNVPKALVKELTGLVSKERVQTTIQHTYCSLLI